jgi:hypothetical protein
VPGESLRVVAYIAGLVVVVGTAASVARTLVLPRGGSSRIAVLVVRACVLRLFMAVAARVPGYERKDRILALAAPASLLALLLTWLLFLVAGYALMLLAVTDLSVSHALREAGSSTFTLGFTASAGSWPALIDVFAAISGLVVLALLIGYLPVLYGAFNRRETLVTLLQSRAGAPAWGPEILARHQLVDIVDRLPSFYSDWEQWAADLAETHANYPVLVWFRSPHPLRSWVLALLAVLDSAALYLSLCPEGAPSQARLCLRMGFTCLRDIAGSLRMSYDPDPFPDDPLELTYEEFERGVERLQVMGFPVERDAAEAWAHFRGWRVNYESIALRLADIVVAPAGPWSGRRTMLPGEMVMPQRPADRRPEDPHDEDRPKGHMGF